MTPQEAKKMLKAKLECLKRETSGTDFDCNQCNCDECPLNYEQGNMGEQKEALDMAVQALEQQSCEDCISRQAVNTLVDELARAISDERCFISRGRSTADIMQDILDLPSVTPSYNLEPYSDKLWKNAYERGKADAEQTRWIPVSERLPENAKHKGAFCPKYYVMTEFGQTEGWYNPDVGCWYVLLWFMDARFEKWNISLERGDVPKLVKNVPVVAWMPLPEPYKAESEDA